MTPPSIEQLALAPELAAIVVLEAAAHTAILALAAVYPEIQNLDERGDSFELRVALDIIDTAHALAASLNRYRLAVQLAQERDDLLPF